eukprot:jgi/Hompol1/2630/HPOL_006088-RA
MLPARIPTSFSHSALSSCSHILRHKLVSRSRTSFGSILHCLPITTAEPAPPATAMQAQSSAASGVAAMAQQKLPVQPISNGHPLASNIRMFHASRVASNYHNFDTYRFVQRLEADGFSRDGAEAIMNSLTEVVGESVNNLSATSVTSTEFEKHMYMSRVDFTQLRSEIQLLEKNEFALLKADIGRLKLEIEKLKLRMVEDLRRVQSNVRLDLSLDKGRIRDEQSAKEIRIKEADSKIDTEVSTLRTQMETIQWELFKTLF